MVARSLRLLGLDASDNSRNDILIGDRKVSGNSYYHIKGRSIVHGTMLYDFDPEMMAGALTPPAVKLQSHGVSSVRSRVTTIREQLPSLSMADFKAHILRTIPDQDRSLILSPSDLAEVEEIEKAYRRPEWLTGQNPTHSHTTHRGSGHNLGLPDSYLRKNKRVFIVGRLSVNCRKHLGNHSRTTPRHTLRANCSDSLTRLTRALVSHSGAEKRRLHKIDMLINTVFSWKTSKRPVCTPAT